MGSAYTEKAGVVVQSDLVAEKQQGGGKRGMLEPWHPIFRVRRAVAARQAAKNLFNADKVRRKIAWC